jgi:large-conductance mechanosensitive channel
MVLKDELRGFFKFLIDRNIFQSGISFLIASQVNSLSKNLIDTIIKPILEKIIDEEIRNQDTDFLGIKFKTGQLILNLINFMLVMFFIYYLYKITKPEGLIQNLFSGIYEIFD